MIQGPTYLKQCPNCGKHYTQRTLTSGNTGGATYWGDGKMEAPMLPKYPDIIQCFSCNTIFRISEQPKVDVRDACRLYFNISKEHTGDHPKWENAKSLAFYQTSAETYLKCLDTDLVSKKGRYTEKKLRILAWRRFNDRFRNREKFIPIQWTPKFRQNAEKLLELLDETDTSEVTMKAEIYRELGAFDKSIDLLEDLARDNDSVMIKKIFTLSKQGKSELVVVKEL